MSNLRYLSIRAGSRQDIASRLAERLALYTHDELLRDALEATAHNDQVRAINRLAIGTSERDPAVVTVIRLFATQAQHPLLREAAVNAMGFRAWPDFRPWLEHIATADPIEDVRLQAARLLAHWPATEPG